MISFLESIFKSQSTNILTILKVIRSLIYMANLRIPYISKLQSFDCKNFKCWSKRLLFYLQSIKVNQKLLVFPETIPRIIKLCRGHILHHMNDTLCDLYRVCEFARQLWIVLKKKYDKADIEKKKYIVG